MKIHLSLPLAALVLAGPLWAQAPKLDANGDGSVSLEEFQAAQLGRVRERFAALDTNGDGSISLEEFQSRPLAASQRRFAGLDTDGDGELSAKELEAARHRGRAPRTPIDTNGDGAWSFAELQAVRPDLTIEQFNRLDRNGDGLITPDERPFRGRPGPYRYSEPDATGGGTPTGR